VNNPRGWVAGAATLTWRGVVTVPTSVWGGVGHLYLTSSSSAPAAINTLAITSTGAADLTITQNGGIFNTDFRRFIWSSFRTTYSGQTITLELIFTQGTANPVVRVNEVDISALFSLTTGGTVPAWLDAAMVPTYHLTGYNWPSGPAPVGCFILGSLTDADRAFHRSTGHYPAWVVAGGSMLQNTGTCYTTFGAAITGASSSGFSLTTVGTGYHEVRTAPVFSAVKGQTVNISFTQTGAQPLTCFLNDGVQYFISASGSNSFTATVQNSTSSNQLVLAFSGTSGASFAISNLVVRPNGALSLPVIQPIAVLDDATTIGGNQARLVGVTPVTNKRDWRICADTWTNGNQRILEGALIDSTADIIDTIEQTTTGTPTTTIGSDSAGSQYKASSALTAGINPTTLVTRKAASNEFWVGSNSTAVVRTTIKGHRAV
jgi:hypothetical protein